MLDMRCDRSTDGFDDSICTASQRVRPWALDSIFVPSWIPFLLPGPLQHARGGGYSRLFLAVPGCSWLFLAIPGR